MAKPKCMYKSESEGKCHRSTSEHHCKDVTDAICDKCILQQGKPIVSDKVKFKNIIKLSIEQLKTNDTKEALRILESAIKI